MVRKKGLNATRLIWTGSEIPNTKRCRKSITVSVHDNQGRFSVAAPGAAWLGLHLASALCFRVQQAFRSVVLLPLRFVSTFFGSMFSDSFWV